MPVRECFKHMTWPSNFHMLAHSSQNLWSCHLLVFPRNWTLEAITACLFGFDGILGL